MILKIEVPARGSFIAQSREDFAPSVTSTAYQQNTFVVIEYDEL